MSSWLGIERKIDKIQKLKPLNEYFTTSRNRIKESGDLTVRLRRVHIDKYYDRILRNNDLFIVSEFQFGKEPTISRLHYSERNSKDKEFNAFFNEMILAKEDFEDHNFKYRIKVYDLDNFNQELVEGVTNAAKNSALIFPQLAPYIYGVNHAVSGVSSLIKKIDKHDRIVESEVIFRRDEEGHGVDLLQEGYFVCFDDTLDEKSKNQLYIDENLVVWNDRSKKERFNICAYVVLEINNNFYDDKTWEIDQKVAKLMAEIERGNDDSANNKSLDFLQETLTGYSNYKKIQRAMELVEMKKTNSKDFTKEKAKLLERYRNDDSIKEFIPSQP